MDALLRVLYWLAVLAISLALLIGLVLFLESRDPGAVESARSAVLTQRATVASSPAGGRRRLSASPPSRAGGRRSGSGGRDPLGA